MRETIAALPLHFGSGASILRHGVFSRVQTVHIQLDRIVAISLHGRIVDAAAASSAARTVSATNLKMAHSIHTRTHAHIE